MQPADDPGRQQRVAVTRGRASLLRKLLHLAMAVVPAAGWLLSYELALVLAALFLAASILLEVVRRRGVWANRLLWHLLPSAFRPGEEGRMLGSTWFSVGMLAALFLWGRDLGGVALLFLAWGDPAAEFAGRRWGRSGVRKTWVGSAACLATCLLAGVVGVGLAGLGPATVWAGALVATLAERWPPPPDDNVWIPLFSGLAMAAVEWLIGGQIVLFPLWC